MWLCGYPAVWLAVWLSGCLVFRCCYYADQPTAAAENIAFADPRSYGPYVQLGLLFLGANNVPKAIELFQTAIKAFPKEAYLHTYFGEILLSCQQGPEAEKCFDKAIAIDKTCALPLVHKGWLQIEVRKDLQGGVAQIKEATVLDPTCHQVCACLQVCMCEFPSAR